MRTCAWHDSYMLIQYKNEENLGVSVAELVPGGRVKVAVTDSLGQPVTLLFFASVDVALSAAQVIADRYGCSVLGAVDVCIAGNPAVNGFCGETDCVCWPVADPAPVAVAVADPARVVHTRSAWADFMEAMAKLIPDGDAIEIDSALYDEFLGVLPPVYQQFREFGFAEGAERVKRFFFTRHCDELRYFCQLTSRMNPYA